MLGRVAGRAGRTLQRRQLGQQPGDAARHLGALQSRVERLRIGPNGTQLPARVGPPQVGEIEAEAFAIGELRVVLAGAGEVGIEVEAEADVADDQERRPALLRRDIAGIALGLPLDLLHVSRPFRRVADVKPALVVVIQLERRGLDPGRRALLGFQHEAAALIEVDALAARAAVVAVMPDRALQAVVAAAGRAVRALHAQDIAQLVQECRVVCPLRHAGAVPTEDKALHRVGNRNDGRAGNR